MGSAAGFQAAIDHMAAACRCVHLQISRSCQYESMSVLSYALLNVSNNYTIKPQAPLTGNGSVHSQKGCSNQAWDEGHGRVKFMQQYDLNQRHKVCH